MTEPGATRRWAWLVPAALTAYFTVTAVATAGASYRGFHLAVLAVLYGLASVALASAWGLLRHLGRPAGLAGAAGVASVAVWHFREQTGVPDSIFAVLPLALVLGVLLGLAAERLAPRPDCPRSALWALAASAAAFAAALPAAYFGSEELRWHLLRHNTLLGTPAYYLLETSTFEREAELFDAHRDGGAGDAVERVPDTSVGVPGTTGSESGAPDAGSPDAGSPDAGSPDAGQGGPERPHVVFVLLDTLRADALTAWGGEAGQMPFLDRFLDGAWRFTDVLANSSWTRPSMASFFTGLLPEEHGARDVDDALGEGHVTLAEALQGRGYRTVAFVTNLAAVGESAGFAQGFDRYVELAARPYARAATVERAVRRWLEAEPPAGSEPLFLYLHYLDPHEPYLAGEPPAARRAADYLAAYRAELAYLDGRLGEVLALLRERLPGPTWVFVTSDHGEEFFEHGLFGHGHSLYQELLHIPAALHAPGGDGGNVGARLEARDFFDLLLRLGSGESVDVESWARRRSRERRYASVYYTQTGRLILRPYLRKTLMRMTEEGGTKLIWSGYGDTRELYDLGSDPGERRNLLARRPGEAEHLSGTFDGHVRFWTFGEAFEPSDEVLEQLRDLGYLD